MALPGAGSTTETGFWAWLSRREGALWAVVVALMLADTLLTYYGIERGLAETNPVARAGLERFGYATLGALKLLALGVALACRPLLPRGYTAVVPLSLALPWFVASLINAVVIGVALR
ncbi:DUF5658 family protein [Halalkalicoccus salilacus]|uniref:DUF5658 family protein n=1 Tax=Halalkalicoccus TaxID=332246 RepID=UPI002F96AC8E